jgi:ABC-type transport system involved in multi-copper enzyme maturation permease subunit
MTWVAWRQLRSQIAVAAVAAAAVCIVLLATRGHVAAVGDPDRLSKSYQYLRLLGTALIGVPAFVGAFWGAPLLAREYEAGTHRLAWTQSVTRGRWLTAKLVIAVLAAVVLVGAFSALFTWWSLPLDHFGNRIGTANFGQRGIVPVAYALFALSLGTLFGTIMRRTLPAMAATLVGFFVVRFAFQLFVRPHLLAPVSVSRPTSLFERTGGNPGEIGGWVVSSKTVDAAGHVINGGRVDQLLADSCALTRESSGNDFARCADHLAVHDVVRIHPDSQFWAMQAWEAAIFVALAAGLAFATYWWLKRRAG